MDEFDKSRPLIPLPKSEMKYFAKDKPEWRFAVLLVQSGMWLALWFGTIWLVLR